MPVYWVEQEASWVLWRDGVVVCETFDAELASQASRSAGWRVEGIRAYLAGVNRRLIREEGEIR